MGYFIGFFAAILFGSNGSVVKVVVNSGVSAAQITFFRVFVALLISFVILLLTERTAFRISRKRMLGMAILGIAGVAMLQWFYALAIARIPVGIALLFEYLAVLAVAVIARFVFKEAVRGRIWVAVSLVLVGLAVVAQIWTSNVEALGMVFALGAAAAYTVYFIMGERALTGMSVMSMTFWAMLFASLFWGVFSGWWQMDLSLFTQEISMTGSLAALVLPMWVPLLWTVTIGSFAAFYLSFLALKHLKATSAGIVASSEVIFAFIVAWVWLGESLTSTQIVGALVVVAGIILAQTARPGKVIDLDLASRIPPKLGVASTN
jgi:drug/metabolite transporter (DMT)-like permease